MTEKLMPSESDDQRLWCLHHIGPDDVHPAPDFATAQEWANHANEFSRQYAGISRFVVAVWPWTAKLHADGLEASITDWSPAPSPTPAADEVVDVDAWEIVRQIASMEGRTDAQTYWFGKARDLMKREHAAIAAMQARSAEPAGEEPVAAEYNALIAAGFDDYAARCALQTEDDGGFCHAYFYSDGQWRFQTGGGELTYRQGKTTRCVLTKRLYARPATPTNPERLVEHKAAEAIRKAFFTSVSGGSPQYHLSLAYQSIDEMHEAEDAIKVWAKSVLEPKA